MIKPALLLAACLAAAPLSAQTHPADQVSEDRLHDDVAKLVSFGTRHTLSSQDDPKRGIGAAVEQHIIAGESDFGADRVWRVDFKLPASAKALNQRTHSSQSFV